MSWSWRNDMVFLVGSAILLLYAFSIKESGDMGTAAIGFFLYFPDVLLLALYNGVVMRLSLAYARALGAFIGVLPVIPLLVWFAMSGGVVTFRYWKLHAKEWAVLMTVLVALDLMNLYFIRKRQASQGEERK